MMKSALERMLNTEMDVHLGRKALTVNAEQRPVETPPAESLPARARRKALGTAAMGVPARRCKATWAN